MMWPCLTGVSRDRAGWVCPDVTSVPSHPDPAAAFERAGLLIELRRPEMAVRLLRDVLPAHTDRPDLWGQLAVALLAADRPQEALAAAEERLRLAPDDEWGHRLRGAALTQLGRHQEAIQAAADSVRLGPLDWHTHLALALALAAAGQWKPAWPVALHAVRLAPQESEAHSAVGLVAIGRGDWRRAEAAYRHVLSIDPGDALARSNLALVALGRGRAAQAVDGSADAVAADPGADLPRRNLQLAARIRMLRLLSLPGLAAGLGWLAVSGPVATMVAAALIAGALAVVAGAAAWTWRSLPRPVRAYLGMKLRTDRDLLSVVGFGVAGLLALSAAAALLPAGHPTVAKAAAAAAGVFTVAAYVNAIERQPRPPRQSGSDQHR